MIFEQEYIVFELFDVLQLDQACSRLYNSNRNFDALSFRFESDTVIESNNKQTEFPDNSICYVPANVSYTRNSIKDKLIVIHFKAFNYHSNKVERIIPKNPEKYRELFSEILNIRNNNIAYKNMCASVLCRIFNELYKDNMPICKNQKLYDAVIFMEQNYFDCNLSPAHAAEHVFMSDSYFRKLFKKEFGITPKQYIIEKRINYAKSLLLTGYFTIEQVATKCGYTDCKYFSAEFKRLTGFTPSAFRYNFIQ